MSRITGLSQPIRQFISTGPVAHVVTLDADGAPQVSLAWVGLDGAEVVIGTLNDQPNLRRDPRIALSFQAPGRNAYELDHYLVLRGTARVTDGGAAALLHDLAQVYIGAGTAFPPMPDPPPGYQGDMRDT